MASIKAFTIKNFKGIRELRLDLATSQLSPRYSALIGLNESGKTTILEAISQSVLADEATSALVNSTRGQPELNDLIPKHEKAAFTGDVTIETHVILSESDRLEISRFITKDLGYRRVDNIPHEISITRQYSYVDSTHKTSISKWGLSPTVGKTTSSSLFILNQKKNEEWVKMIMFTRKLLPNIIYFPTFLVTFPPRIYLEGDHGKPDAFYREIISDALQGLERPLSLQKHILDRAQKHRTAATKSLGSALRSSPEGPQIDATIQELSAELNRVIFGAWHDIFGKKIRGRQIVVEWHIDEDANKHLYLEIYILAGKSRYYISERSLGFRWFFTFLLFTQFQSKRSTNSNLIYLFDEPASHLHAKAQIKLLSSFEKIAHPDHMIVYSTHSHYLINPLWLEQAFIVQNLALDVEDDDPEIELSDIKTDITATKYKRFVSSNPSKLTYFQPVLDALDYSLSPLSFSGDVIILEGKYDYYAFQYLSNKARLGDSLKIFPAVGAGTMAATVAIMRGIGRRFFILLDDDAAGRRERDRYKKELLLSDNFIATLGDIEPTTAGKAFEALYQSDITKLFAAVDIPINGKPSKYDYYLLFQTLITRPQEDVKIPVTLKIFEKIVRAVRAKLEAQN